MENKQKQKAIINAINEELDALTSDLEFRVDRIKKYTDSLIKYISEDKKDGS